jgi:hypothetical protein
MDRNKIILIVLLALIVVAYIVFVVYGSVNHDKTNKDERKSSAKSYKPNPSTKKFGSIMGEWLGRFMPRPEISCAIPAPKDAELVCSALAINQDIQIPAKKGSSFRIATLVLTQGKAHVEYDDKTDAASNAKMDEQPVDLPDPENNNARQTSIVIFENGGKLHISCQENTQCGVGLK